MTTSAGAGAAASAFRAGLREAEEHRGAIGHVLLAVSGGPDSLALLLAAVRAGGAALSVATVDHGLRPESAAEARFVGDLCRATGLAHRILRWRPSDLAGNLPAAAREARYALLVAEARRIGAGALATAHHAGDQRETFCHAEARGASGVALAGMRPWRDLEPGLLLLRPFLALEKADLGALVRREGVTAVEDPSNRDLRFARPRWRQALDESASLRARTDWGLAEAQAARRSAERALSGRIETLAAAGLVRFCGRSEVRLARDEAGAPELLSRLLAAAAGAPARPEAEAVARLVRTIERQPSGRATLAGALVEWDRDTLRFGREWGRAGVAPLRPDLEAGILFDRRFSLSLETGEPGEKIVGLRALGLGNGWDAALPVLLAPDGRVRAAHPVLLPRFPGARALRGRAEAGWRAWADLPGRAPPLLTPRLHFAANAGQPVGKDLAATYLA